MIELIFSILGIVFILYFMIKYGRKPKEEPVNADIKISFTLNDDGVLESTNYLNNKQLS